MEEFGLKDLIRQTRLEIEAAAREREDAGEAGLFQVDSVTIEANFVVRKGGEGGAGVKFLAVTLDGNAKYEKEQVQKVTVVLSPVRKTQESVNLLRYFKGQDMGVDVAPLLHPVTGARPGQKIPYDLQMQVPLDPRLVVKPSPVFRVEGLGFHGIVGGEDSDE